MRCNFLCCHDEIYIIIKIAYHIFQNLQGYRVISVDIPRVWNHHEWIQAFEKFLDAIDVHHVSSSYLYGIFSKDVLFIG